MNSRLRQTVLRGVIVLAAIAGLTFSPIMSERAIAIECAGVQTSIIECNAPKGGAGTDSGIWKILLIVLNIMTAGVGILAVGGIVYASILHASSSDKSDQAKKAISMINDIVIGIIAYGLMYLALNFLIPGGIFT